MDPGEFELVSGVRMDMQAVPNCQEALDSLCVPLTVHFTPAKRLESVFLSTEPPNKCVCGSYLNPSSVVNYATKTWFCNFCVRSNKLTNSSVQQLQPNTLLPEQQPQSIVYEYRVPDVKTPGQTASYTAAKNNYVLLLDTCLNAENMQGLKRGVIEAMKEVDFERTQVILMTYSRNLSVYRNNCTRVFSQAVVVSALFSYDNFAAALGFKKDLQKEFATNAGVLSKHVFTDLETLTNAVESIESDSFEVPADERQQRATGKAIDLAIEFIRLSMIDSPRLLLFIGGPCTLGNGKIADLKISSFIRKHLDVETKAEVKTQVEQVKRYYSDLATKAVQLRIVVDVWGFSLTEFGLYEMSDLFSKTNGMMVVNEEFKQEHFGASLKSYFRRDDNGCPIAMSGATVELLVSKELRISGCIGNCETLNNKPATQSENPIGLSNTNKWYVGGLDPESTFLYVFEIAEKSRAKGHSKYAKAYFQFIVTYKHPVNGKVVRVVSFDRPFVTVDKAPEMLSQIDQFSVVSSYAKLAALRVFEYDQVTMIRYLDKVLISMLKTFRRNQEVPEEINYIPQYFYYLRKSNFVKRFASSLDEMTFYKHSLLRETIDNTLIIVQPQVVEYSLSAEEPCNVLPDLSCLKKDVVLLADTFFNVIIWQGATIKAWIDAGYHNQPEYAHLADLLKLPEDDFGTIAKERVVAPAKVYAHYGSPTERFLKSRLNPEAAPGASADGQQAVDEGNFVTEDASLSVFMGRLLEYLKEPQK